MLYHQKLDSIFYLLAVCQLAQVLYFILKWIDRRPVGVRVLSLLSSLFLGFVTEPWHSCFVLSCLCLVSCTFMSCLVQHAACVLHWLCAFMLSCFVWTHGLWVFSIAVCSCLVLCVHMAGDLFDVFDEHMAFHVMFPCAMCSAFLLICLAL